MPKFKFTLFLLLLMLLIDCSFIKDSFTYKDKTKDFVESLMKQDYDKCFSQMALESKMGKNTNIDTLKSGLFQFRSVIEQNFGKNKFEFTLMEAGKKRSTIASQNTPPNTTLAMIQFSNDREFGVFRVLFDDHTKKIMHINMLEVREPKPNMLLFWLFGIFPLAVLLFNIYVILKIKKSKLSKKWLKYLAVLFFNVPAITYAAVGGLSFKLLSFQIFFGIGFTMMGYLGSVWTFGIPLGGIYWLWKLNQHKERQIFMDKADSALT